MSPILIAALWFLAGAVFALIALMALLYKYADQFAHRVRYKVWTLPCPACRDESDRPTGKVVPDNPLIRQMAGDDLPEFDCATCSGTKKVRYEFPRLEPPVINERQMVEGPAPDALKRRKRGLLG